MSCVRKEKYSQISLTEEKHTYDEADRLIDSGVEYEVFGDQTKVPAVDAGGNEITASFYVDNQVAVQTQNGETTSYSYDPAGRTEKTVSEGTTKAAVINHYAGPGEAISWACEETVKECEEGKGTKWTRDIPGIDGSLSAVEKSGEAAVLQLHDLQGDIVATAAKSETETKLLSTYNSTEFGVQVNGTPSTKYSWLGASGLATEASSAATASGGASYVPQLGRPLQTQPIGSPGAFPNGSYTGGVYATTLEPWVNQSIGNWGAGGTGREATRQAEAKKHQEEEEARARADRPPEAIPTPTEGGAEPLGGSEGWACQYAAETGQEGEGCVIMEGEFGGSSSGLASASSLWLVSEATKALESASKKLGDFIVKEVKYQAHKLWAEVSSTYTLDAAQCYQGASSMKEALSNSLEAWPEWEAFALIVGCAAETQDGHVDQGQG
jgi:YD repeat-containing protein